MKIEQFFILCVERVIIFWYTNYMCINKLHILIMKKIFFLAVLLFPAIVSAHQPRIVHDNFIQIENPQISQAFYGELKGEPHEYEIISKEPFKLYAGILIPAVDGAKKDISAEIYRVEEDKEIIISRLDGPNYNWTIFYEKYANDYYYWGPEFKGEASTKNSLRGKDVIAGKYIIKVFSPNNTGKYSLAVGEEEIFHAKDIVNAAKVLPELKTSFFGKSIISLFFSRSGLYMLVPLVVLLGFVFAGVFISVKLSRNRFKQ